MLLSLPLLPSHCKNSGRGKPLKKNIIKTVVRALCCRAAQKLNLSSPHRRKRHSSSEEDLTGFCGGLHRYPPPFPPALLRRIGVKEVTGVGKVRTRIPHSISTADPLLPLHLSTEP
ncbi:hypothetical protein PR048_000796 [Dryococelus australis]|uniref:Uncharacterized protein n=1 Tax=Dryococelus australis TaxID=614101 RepID=A0ABQ9IHZ8_9NEOP|nr:hypothetical protein PR048_000796 [Dryococelus australis]